MRVSTFCDEMEDRIMFRLTGKTSKTDEEPSPLLMGGDYIISGDYDSATDALSEEKRMLF